MAEFEAADVTVTVPNVPEAADFDLGGAVKAPESVAPIQKQDDGVDLLRRQLSEKQREADENRRQRIEEEQHEIKKPP